MSVYKHGKSGIYHYDFAFKRRRHHGSTGKRSKREAEKVEQQRREEARLEAERLEAMQSAPMTVALACATYLDQVGQYHVEAKTTERNLAWLIRHFGPEKRLMDITGRDIAEMVARRRQDGVAPATVNRHATEVLRKVMRQASEKWGQQLQRIKWGDYMLDEPRERIREASSDEETKILDALRPDYRPLILFALASGARMSEAVNLRWTMVDWSGGIIRLVVKGSKKHTIPITPGIREILWPLQGHDEMHVFTYVCDRESRRRKKGERYAITREGLKTEWRRAKARHKVEDFRFHDLRHTAATRLLRATGNLKLVQRLLGHEAVTTTTKYAHADLDDLRAGMERVTKSRQKSRTKREVG